MPMAAGPPGRGTENATAPAPSALMKTLRPVFKIRRAWYRRRSHVRDVREEQVAVIVLVALPDRWRPPRRGAAPTDPIR